MTSEEVFKKFVPATSVSYCNKLYQQLGFEFKVKKARQTKMGDYRYDPRNGKHTISINNDLNPYAFLVTYLHEVAHHTTYIKYGNRVLPHGREWKSMFQELALPVLTEDVFTLDILQALQNYFRNPKASSCSDPVLFNIIRKYDIQQKNQLKDILIGGTFNFNKRTFQKLERKRTRSVCLEIKTGKKYSIPEIAEVQPLD